MNNKLIPSIFLKEMHYKIVVQLLGKVGDRKDWIMLHNVTIFGVIEE
jgi:hypothetical protein